MTPDSEETDDKVRANAGHENANDSPRDTKKQEKVSLSRRSNSNTSESTIRSASSHSHAPSAGHGGAKEPGVISMADESSRVGPPERLVIKVPVNERQGLFARLVFLAEITEPKAYSRPHKWYITFVIALAAVAAPLGSAILFPALPEISEDFHTKQAITNFAAAFYMLAMGIFPLWWSSFSEKFGRRTVYLVSFSLFLLWNILSALSVNVAMLIVMRVLGGGAAASVQAVGAGTIADIWDVHERGRAIGFFYLGPLLGPFLAPIIGGALTQGFGWRSTQWFLAIYGGVVLIFMIFALPETHRKSHSEEPRPVTRAPSDQSAPHEMGAALSRSSTSRSVSAAVSKYSRFLKNALYDPLKILLYLRYPPVIILVYYSSITFGALYLLNVSIETTFSSPPYSFQTIIVGLCYVPNSLGYILASLFGGRWTDRIMAREARRANLYDEKGQLKYRPEDRMRENAWFGAIMYPGALIWYGWTAERHTFWLVPLLANFFFGVGSMLIFAMSTTMLTEFMPRRASSGVAVNNFVRNICSCIGALVAQPLIEAIGNGWLFTIMGLLALFSSVVVWIMHRFGPKWRVRMVEDLG